MISLFTLFLISLIASVADAGVGALDELPKTRFNADLTHLELLILTNIEEKNVFERHYSKFIADLVSSGHKITFKSFNKFSQESELNLTLYGELIYDNILILDINISKHYPSFPISYVQKILEYIDRGGNVMVFVDTLDNNNFSIEPSKGINKLAKESAGIKFLPEYTSLLDISSDLTNTGHVYSNNCLNSNAVLSSETCQNEGILYRGVGFSLNTPNNELIVPILLAGNTCISIYNQLKSKSLSKFGSGIHSSTGEEIGLVVSMQARNNARVTFSSDGKLCSDEIIERNMNNRKFCKEISLWSFQQKGLIKIEEIVHYKLNNDSRTFDEHYDDTLMYTVEDLIFFSAKFHHFIDHKWEVYPSNDIQLEFTMLDPYIRTFLQLNQTNPENVTFSTIFKAPEVWGVFKFVINHNRMGYNTISYESLATVRNFRHNQNPRFVISAYPYYASFIVTLIFFSYFTSIFISLNRVDKKIKYEIK